MRKTKLDVDRLKYNLQKQGVGNVNVMQEDSRKLSDFFSFDKILLDASMYVEVVLKDVI